MTKVAVVVADSFGSSKWLNPKFNEHFPHHDIWLHNGPGVDDSREPHPHGGMVMSVAAIPVFRRNIEWHLYNHIGSETQDEAMMGIIPLCEKVGAIGFMNSWGASPTGIPVIDYQLDQQFVPFKNQVADWQAKGGLVTASLGNTNNNGLTTRESVFPWRYMNDVVNCGGINRAGKLLDWSSDAVDETDTIRKKLYRTKATAAAVAHRRWCLNPLSGMFDLASGTSFSNPAVFGVLLEAYLRGDLASFDYDAIYQYILDNGELNGNEPGHANYGAGSLENLYQKFGDENRGFLDAGLPMPQNLTALTGTLHWFEWTKLR